MPPLTEAKLRALKPAEKVYRVADDAGLYIEVHPNGSRYWRQKYRWLGREKRLAHGVYPEVSLAQARAKRDESRAQLRAGIDPGAAKRAARAAAADDFEAIAREWLDRERKHGKGRGGKGLTETTAAATLARMEQHVFPYIGRDPIRALTAADILERVLRRLDEAGKAETAHRVKWIISRVFRYAVQTRRADTDPTSALRGALAPVRPEHHPAITEPRAVGALLRAIDGYDGTAVVRAALRLAPLLFVRPDELNRMEWRELDLGAALWRIPAERTKMRREHLVPLSRQALAILREIEPLTGRGRYVFPAMGKPGRPISENTLNGALRRLGYSSEEHTAHGFRSTASTLLHELGFGTRVIEVQLAHKDRDQTRGIYNRALYLPQRTEMMQAWADYLDSLKQPAPGRAAASAPQPRARSPRRAHARSTAKTGRV